MAPVRSMHRMQNEKQVRVKSSYPGQLNGYGAVAPVAHRLAEGRVVNQAEDSARQHHAQDAEREAGEERVAELGAVHPHVVAWRLATPCVLLKKIGNILRASSTEPFLYVLSLS